MRHNLLFVHYDPKAGGTKVNRSIINTHSNRVYHRSKREENVRRYKEFSEDNSLCASPLTLLGRGNSDPFNAYAVTIDAFVNRILDYHLRVILPKRFSVEVETRTRLINTRREWDETIGALEDASTGNAILALFGSRLADTAHDPTLSRLAIVYKSRSLALLRRRLALQEYKTPDELYQSILLLMMADFGAGNLTDAAVHARILMHLIQKGGGLSNVDPKIRRLLLSIDAHQASTTLHRPWVNLNGWMLGVYPQALDLNMQMTWLASKPAMDDTLDDIFLRCIFARIREAVDVFDWATSTSSERNGEALLWSLTQGSSFVNCLVNKYLDITEVGSGEGLHSPPIITQDGNIRAYTCLAAIYWTRRTFGVEAWRVGKVVQESGPIILPRLRDLLRSDEARELRSDVHGGPYSRLRLWALYIGAVVEQDQSDRFGFPGASDKWFTVHLATQARHLSLQSWQEMRTILEGFIYSDRVVPNGSTWFGKLMSGACHD